MSNDATTVLMTQATLRRTEMAVTFRTLPQCANEPLDLSVTSNGGQPVVTLSSVNVHAHLDATQARQLAVRLLEAAAAIERPAVAEAWW